jgi:hypothetical protein
MTSQQISNLTRAVLAADDMGEALALIEAAMPTADPVEAYWDIFERADMAAELDDE